MMINRTCARRLRWLKSGLLLWRGDHVSAVPIEPAPANCFGPPGEREQLALEGFIAGIDPQGQGAPREPSRHDSSKWVA